MTDDRELDATSWGDYYRHTLGRELRPPFVRAMHVLREAGITPAQAVEVGFGDGEETLALLADGWRVLAIDASPQAAEVLGPRVPAEIADRLEIRSTPAEETVLPRFDFLYAGYTLPFLGAEAFGRFWAHALDRANPGGYLAVNFFGPHDTWADRPNMQFHERAKVERLVEGLDVVVLDETEEDGPSFLGPKHWHLFEVIARKPSEQG